jgi:hypothetical protein
MRKTIILPLKDNRILRDAIKALINGRPDLKIVAATQGNRDTIVRIQGTLSSLTVFSAWRNHPPFPVFSPNPPQGARRPSSRGLTTLSSFRSIPFPTHHPYTCSEPLCVEGGSSHVRHRMPDNHHDPSAESTGALPRSSRGEDAVFRWAV